MIPFPTPLFDCVERGDPSVGIFGDDALFYFEGHDENVCYGFEAAWDVDDYGNVIDLPLDHAAEPDLLWWDDGNARFILIEPMRIY